MVIHFQRICVAVALFVPLAGFTAVQAADTPKDIYAPGTRQGPFVTTTRTLGDLAKDGYEIRGNLGTALVLQKAASIYSCAIPPDPEHLSYRAYFVCSALDEQPVKDGKSAMEPVRELPRLKLDKPQR
ncbi:MAG: hypothetical protein Q7S99_04500 [Parvibaculum sp.]|nr:hypothetical protein [Parvibaculum sp.]|tara:strand:- start:1561 stop:1944 length:384 start_codon:yes stop_codon:yes gene_type:complete